LRIARFRPLGYTPYLREEAGLVALQALPVTETAPRWRIGVNVALFVLTCLSTLVAGLSFVGSPTFDALRTDPSAARFLAGAPFAGTLLAILGVHELGHYFTARHYRASVSLPYFIPAPFLFGTLGAIILMRSPARDRNSLFDIAAAGPLAGLAVALPAGLLGFAWSSVVPVPPGGYMAFGDSVLTWGLSYLRFGHIPPGYMLFTHPIADAAWAGFLVTALNLFPVGQLDGPAGRGSGLSRPDAPVDSTADQPVGRDPLAGCGKGPAGPFCAAWPLVTRAGPVRYYPRDAGTARSQATGAAHRERRRRHRP